MADARILKKIAERRRKAKSYRAALRATPTPKPRPPLTRQAATHQQFLRHREQARSLAVPYKPTRSTREIIQAIEPPRPTAGGYRGKRKK